MDSSEKEKVLRDAFDKLIEDGLDPLKIRKRAVYFALAFRSPTLKRYSDAQIGKILGISRQAVHSQVDKWTVEFAEMHSNSSKSSGSNLTTPSLNESGW